MQNARIHQYRNAISAVDREISLRASRYARIGILMRGEAQRR